MAFDLKRIALVVGVFLTVIVVCSVLYVFTEGWEQQNNDVVGSGQFADPSLKFVTVVCLYFKTKWSICVGISKAKIPILHLTI